MDRPFSGLRVLDLTHVLAGPFATYMLAVHGAETIKIEPPGEPDPVRGRGPDQTLNERLMGINYLTQGANKRAITLDLKTEAGRRILRRLAERADVLVENYRAGALASLGLGYSDLRRLNPRLVYCSLTGYGQGGPRSAVNAYDNVVQAASGLMAMTGTEAASPMKVGASIVDYAAGMAAAFAIAAALQQRSRTGEGVWIDCAMLDAALMLMGTQVTAAHAGAPPPKPRGNEQSEAGLGCYETADGLLMLGAFNRRQHERLWLAFERPDLARLSSWTDMARHASAMRALLAERLKAKTAAAWEDWFHELSIPAERVRTINEALALAEAQERPVTARLPIEDSRGQPVRVPLAPFRLSRGSAAITVPPPAMGADTDAVLDELGLNAGEIAELRKDGVI
ncbi:MAG: CoA transferase [Proteobacteria bacterium]|nr:CoA transferase [Pseudomonadota bacterium]MBI3499772.1 CoA transferase [Pseudomonadota bacterium]